MGDNAIKEIVKEAKLLDDKEKFMPISTSSLSLKQKQDVLELITRVTMKRCGRKKGQTCADRRKQREYASKAEASLPRILLELLMMIILTATHEDRQVLVADIAAAYLYTEMEDFVIMKFKDPMVDYMV